MIYKRNSDYNTNLETGFENIHSWLDLPRKGLRMHNTVFLSFQLSEAAKREKFIQYATQGSLIFFLSSLNLLEPSCRLAAAASLLQLTKKGLLGLITTGIRAFIKFRV